MMKKKYNCICKFGTNDIKDFRLHLLRQGMADGKGKHRSLGVQQVSAPSREERLAQIEKGLVATVEQRTASSVTPSPKEVKPKAPARRWWMVLLGFILIVIGCAVSYYGNSKTSSVLIVAGLLGIVPGAFVAFRGFKKVEPEVAAIGTDGKPASSKPTGKENCLNIYPRELGGIKFEYVTDPPFGLPQQCINNGKRYLVNIWNPEKKGLEALIFPDEKYYDPRVLAEVVEAEPVRRYFEQGIQLLEKIAPWAFVAAIGLALLAIIILPGALNPKGG